ncbi:olfactory receptor 2D2-like [Tiliqua scincoides]|uniref:olfactory receptor 2D2-like n=1 Tax=Tiliqua scincoides TaxID=71010 RepID=UPI0034626663
MGLIGGCCTLTYFCCFESRTLDRTAAVNQTSISEVTLVGLTSHRRTQIALFVTILIAYLMTILGNLMVILLVQLDSRLHTPMYFFLSNLSGLEMCFVSSIVPQMLAHLQSGTGRMSSSHCIAQMYLAGALGCTEAVLLGAMAYDRYVAICRPLLYAVAMSRGRCLLLAAFSWACGFLLTGVVACNIVRLPLCASSRISHFFCSLQMVLTLLCGDIHHIEVFILVGGVIILLAPLLVILTSYCLIVIAIVRMSAGAGRSKAFSTCSSHLVVVTMFYGSLITLYMRPRSGTDTSHDKHVAIFYVLITPLLNPVIYTLRNKDVHAAVAKLLRRGGAGHKD